MVGFYAYQRLFLHAPEALIWSDLYFRPHWQLFFDLFNSIPLLGLAALVSWRVGATGALAFFASMLLHCLSDLPLHNDDAHAHFRPITSWRFQSPISYWDPRYYGHLFAAAETLLVQLGAGVLLRSPVRAWRIIGALTLASYALFIAFAVLVWLPDAA